MKRANIIGAVTVLPLCLIAFMLLQGGKVGSHLFYKSIKLNEKIKKKYGK